MRGKTLRLLLVIFTLVNASVLYAGPLDNWHFRNPYPLANDLRRIVYGNNLFVAVGVQGAIETSPDGITWAAQNSGTTESLNDVAYGNGLYVAVGDSGGILTSTDAIAWSAAPSGANQLLSIAYGNNRFVILGGARSFYSSDGMNWTENTSIPQNAFWDVVYGNNRFVAVGDCGVIITSPDGIAWSSAISGCNGAQLLSVTYGSGGFAAAGYGTNILYSSDGTAWSTASFGTGQNHFGATSGNGINVIVGDSILVSTSTDTVWTEYQPGLDGDWYSSFLNSVAYGNNMFVAVGAGGLIATSADGVSWTGRTFVTLQTMNAAAVGNDALVAVGESGRILSSPDGVTWTKRDSGTAASLNGVAFGAASFVAVGNAGTILTSADGIGWASIPSGTADDLAAICYGNGTFMAAAASGSILVSTDGTSWVSGTSGAASRLKMIACGKGLFIAGSAKELLTSIDGMTWTRQLSNLLYDYRGIATDGHTFVVTGYYQSTSGYYHSNSAILLSSDGERWSFTYGGIGDLPGIAFGNGVFSAVSARGTVLTSPDGVEWTERATGAAYGCTGISPGKGTFIITGRGGKIIQSDPIPSAGSSAGSSGAGSSHCFIATAAYGSDLDRHVEVLRAFRDRWLIANPVGRVLVDAYYRVSPSLADYIRRHESLRTATRWTLTPIVFMIEYPWMLLVVILMITALVQRRRWVKRPFE